MHVVIAIAIAITAARPKLPRAQVSAYAVACLIAVDGVCLLLTLSTPRVSATVITRLVVAVVVALIVIRRALRMIPRQEWTKEPHHEYVEQTLDQAGETLERLRGSSLPGKIAE